MDVEQHMRSSRHQSLDVFGSLVVLVVGCPLPSISGRKGARIWYNAVSDAFQTDPRGPIPIAQRVVPNVPNTHASFAIPPVHGPLSNILAALLMAPCSPE